jgi:flagellar biosynthesis protein FlhB
MAEQSSNEEKTQEATPKRREEAHGKGQFARSRYLIPAVTLGAMIVGLGFAGEDLTIGFQRCFVGFFVAAGRAKALAEADVAELGGQAAWLLLPTLAPVLAGVMLVGLGGGFLQSGLVLATEPLRMDFSRINPLQGFGRLFSVETLSDCIKSMVIIAGIGLLGGSALYADLPELVALVSLSVPDIFSYASREGGKLAGWIVGATLAIAGLDYLFQRWRTSVRLRMSQQQVKEEMRDQEGDPQLKGRLKMLRQKLLGKRITADVARADVIITNPTHLAVALRYRVGEMAAPRVLGKGAGFIAEKIREIARTKGIPIVENKPLARLLYSQVEVGRDIPEALYRAVAEVLAYVYGLRKRAPAMKTAAPRA